MLTLPGYVLYAWIIVFGIFGAVVVPYFGAKILKKSGESERFWFYILLLLNFWALLFVLIRPSFRRGLESSDILKLSLFAAGYLLFFLPLPFIP